jgi:hypothetical protein
LTYPSIEKVRVLLRQSASTYKMLKIFSNVFSYRQGSGAKSEFWFIMLIHGSEDLFRESKFCIIIVQCMPKNQTINIHPHLLLKSTFPLLELQSYNWINSLRIFLVWQAGRNARVWIDKARFNSFLVCVEKVKNNVIYI